MRPQYTAFWFVWVLAALVAEVTLTIQRTDVALGLLAAFLVVEGLAVRDHRKGDTLSEHVWVFRRGGWARMLLVGGMVVWLGVRFYQIGNEPVFLPRVGVDPGRAALSVGLVGWLMVHFNRLGRDG